MNRVEGHDERAIGRRFGADVDATRRIHHEWSHPAGLQIGASQFAPRTGNYSSGSKMKTA